MKTLLLALITPITVITLAGSAAADHRSPEQRASESLATARLNAEAARNPGTRVEACTETFMIVDGVRVGPTVTSKTTFVPATRTLLQRSEHVAPLVVPTGTDLSRHPGVRVIKLSVEMATEADVRVSRR